MVSVDQRGRRDPPLKGRTLAEKNTLKLTTLIEEETLKGRTLTEKEKDIERDNVIERLNCSGWGGGGWFGGGRTVGFGPCFFWCLSVFIDGEGKLWQSLRVSETGIPPGALQCNSYYTELFG